MHGGAGDEDRAFQRIGALAAELIGDGGEQPVARAHRLRAGVEQREAAGAVGRFHHAGREAALPDGRRLLVAGDAEDADRPAEQVGHGRAEIAGAIAHLRQQRHRHAEQLGTGPRPMRRGGCRTAACARHWWRRSRAPCRRSAATAGSCRPCRRRAGPASRRLARARRRGRAARRSWWRRNTDRAAARSWPRSSASWPGARAAPRRHRAVRRSCQTMALWIGLPVARSQTIVVSRWLVMPIAGDVACASTPAFAIAVAHGRDRRRPDFLRVVLDLAGRRIDLREFLLRGRDRRERGVEHDGARRGRALVDGEEIVRQAVPAAPRSTPRACACRTRRSVEKYHMRRVRVDRRLRRRRRCRSPAVRLGP